MVKTSIHLIPYGTKAHMVEDFENISCSVCGSKNHEPISKQGQFGIKLHVSICRDCGLVFLNPRWSKRKYTDFYSKEYDRYYRPDLSVAAVKAKSNAQIILSRLGGLYPSKCTNILDVGCGQGEYLNSMGEIFSQAGLYGIEMSANSAQCISKYSRIKILSKDINSDWDKLNEDKFDIVIMRHVLEHFLDPRSVLNKVSSKLSPTGIIYLAVPNMMMPSGSLEKSWFRVVHTYYFSEMTLLKLMKKTLLKPLAIDSSSPEIWGIFSKGNFMLDEESVYNEQMSNLRRYKLRRMLTSPFRFIKNNL